MSAWLTKIVLDPRSPVAPRLIGDAGELHEYVMALVPNQLGDHPRHQAGVLFRLDDDPHRPSLLIQTRTKPNTNQLPDGFATALTRDMTQLLSALPTLRHIHYRLVANAARKLGPNSEERTTSGRRRKPGERKALRGAAAEQWWNDRASGCGLDLLSTQTTPVADPRIVKNGKEIWHAATRFDGIATITDPTALRDSILTGIGRAKSYGCGLLSIAPARGA